jgi:adenosyl cobinamide kinase/adenosyl cobinamide phosphate guanylyltransferase
MELIVGGAYQGKKAYARDKYKLDDAEIFSCSEDGNIDFSCRCICRLERYILACVREGKLPEQRFRPDAGVTCNDVSCGVVPMDAELRIWRETVGRFLNGLSSQAEHVTRMFCGLPQTLK